MTAIADDALWGRVVEVTDAQDRVWRYCGLEEVAVTQREKVTAGTRLGTTGNVPAEAQQGSHLHLGMPQSRRLPGPGKELTQAMPLHRGWCGGIALS